MINETLSRALNQQLERVSHKKASLIIIDGGLGSGKTHTGDNCATLINGGEPIDLKTQYSLGGVDFEEKLQLCVSLNKKVIIYDEAGDFSKRGAISNFNKRINRIFETFRAFEIVIILILPCMDILDIQIFINKIPRMLINCHNKRQGKHTSLRVYDLKKMFYLKEHFRKLIVKPQAYQKVIPNFKAIMKPLNPERTAEIDKLSKAFKQRELDKTSLREVPKPKNRFYLDLADKTDNPKLKQAYKELAAERGEN